MPAEDGQENSDLVERCDGTTLTFCNAGRIEHLDCTSLGFTGREIDTQIAHYGCVPAPPP